MRPAAAGARRAGSLCERRGAATCLPEALRNLKGFSSIQEDLATQPKRQAPTEPPPNSKVVPAAGSTTADPAETGALAEAPGMAAVVVAPPVRRELRGRSRPPNAPRV